MRRSSTSALELMTSGWRSVVHASSRARPSSACVHCDQQTRRSWPAPPELDLADVIIEGVDDAVVRAMVLPLTFRARFAAALREPPPALALSTDLQRKTWRCVVDHGGLPVRTDTVARVVGVTREHLSRAFATARAPNLKRVIDLVRLVAAAELAKNPGYDLRDVATVLGFASASHLSSTTQRIVGLRPPSLARLRAVDLIGRFAAGRGRSKTGAASPVRPVERKKQ